jgi:hypothetical protein
VATPDPAANDGSSPDLRNGSPERDGSDGHSGDLHQTLLREVNERIEELNGSWASDGADGILCECGHPGCMEKIEITAAAYERVRRFPTRFLVKPGHATAGSERIVERTFGYLVVEKVGHAAQTAIQLDPRRRSRNSHEAPR